MKKKTVIDILICILMTCLCLFSFFDTKIIVSHDLTFHLNRFVGLANAFEEGQILPKIYPYANNGFGYATPLFYCDLFLYPFAILYHFGLSAVWCYKTCVLFYTILGNIFVYLIFMKETNDRKLSLFTSFLYLTCNYHLMNIFVRGALGEILAMTFAPLVIYAIYRILIKHEDCFIFLGISFSLLVQSHLISSLLYGIFFFCMIVVFLIMNRKDISLIKKTIITIFKGTIIALLLCAWYLLPMLEQMQSQVFWLTLNGEINTIKTTTQSIMDIFAVSSNMFAPSAGIVFVILNIIYLFIKKEKYLTILYIYIIILYLIILGVIPGTYLNVIQFYFRLYIVIFPLSIIISLYVLDNIKHKQLAMILMIVFLIFSVFTINLQTIKNGEYYLNNNASIDKINSVLNFKYNLDYNHDELGGAEYLPYTEYVDYNNDSLAIKYINKDKQVVDYIYEYDRNFSSIEFACDNERELELLLPLSYYKGYKAYELIDGKWEDIDVLCNQKYKEVSIISDMGEHMYKVKYENTLVQKATLIVSSATMLVLVTYCILERKNNLGYNK